LPVGVTLRTTAGTAAFRVGGRRRWRLLRTVPARRVCDHGRISSCHAGQARRLEQERRMFYFCFAYLPARLPLLALRCMSGWLRRRHALGGGKFFCRVCPPFASATKKSSTRHWLPDAGCCFCGAHRAACARRRVAAACLRGWCCCLRGISARHAISTLPGLSPALLRSAGCGVVWTLTRRRV